MNTTLQKLSPFRFLPLRTYIYYFLTAFTFVSLYFNKYIKDDNLYGQVGNYGESGVRAVLSFQAILPVQYRILIPYLYKFISIFLPISGNFILYFILTASIFFTLIAFYALLNYYFKDKTINSWISPVILYPLTRHVFFNDLWEFYDLPVLFFMVLGFLCIVKERHVLLIIVYTIGFLNKDSVAYLAAAYFIYNFRNMLKLKYIAYFLLMVVLYFLIKMLMVKYLISSNYSASEQNVGIFNAGTLGVIKLNILLLKSYSTTVKLMFLSFGGMHLFILWLLIKNNWRKFNSNLFYVNLVIFPFLLSAPMLFQLTDWRDYIEIVPFITILFLIAFSTLKNSFLQPTDRLLTQKTN